MTNRLSRPLLAALIAAAALVVVSADAEASPGPASLKRAVRSYSTAFLSGDSGRAWHMLTARCRHRLDRDEFAAIVRAAHARFGRAKLRSIRVEVRGNLGRA